MKAACGLHLLFGSLEHRGSRGKELLQGFDLKKPETLSSGFVLELGRCIIDQVDARH